jgi:hypothetical protein
MEDCIKARIYFYCEEDDLWRKVFSEEWFSKIEIYQAVQDLDRDKPACFEIEVQEQCRLSEMLSKAIEDANRVFKAMAVSFQFTEDIAYGDEVYDVYMSKKKHGRPKTGYPSKSLTFKSQNKPTQTNPNVLSLFRLRVHPAHAAMQRASKQIHCGLY